MTDSVILSVFYTDKGKINPHLTGEWLDIHNEYKEYLLNRFVDSESIGETLYRIKNHIEVRPTCAVCGKAIKFAGNKIGFRETCSVSCAKRRINEAKDIYDINIILSDIIENNIINFNKLQDKYLKEHGYYNLIMGTNGRTKIENLYMLATNTNSIPTCKECGKPVRFLNFNDGYDAFCSDDCKERNAIDSINDDTVKHIVFDNDVINNGKVSKKFLQRWHLYDYVMNRYSDSSNLSESLYRIWNNIEVRPTCKVCGQSVKFVSLTKGFAKTCSKKCNIASYDQIHTIDNINDDIIKSMFIGNAQKYGCKFRKLQLYRSGAYDYLKHRFSDCDDIRESAYRILHNIETAPLCKICGKPIKFIGYYPDTCSQTCALRYNKENKLKTLGINAKIYDNELEIIDYCSKHPSFKLSRLAFSRRINANECLCPICNPHKTTSIEDIIKNILNELNITFYIHDRKHIYPLELDFYLPDYNIGIECNGIYWHSDIFKDDKTANAKLSVCKEKNIRLLTFWEDDIINRQTIIKSIIQSNCGLNKKIFARQCNIREIDAETSKNFISRNHLQGNINASIKLGLFYKDELVEVMTFGKLRKIMNQKSQENTYELYRLCTKSGYTIIGGASKLLSYFKTHYNWEKLISYCDKEISYGNVYEKIGFTFDKDCGRSFFYYDKNGVKHHRYSLRKHVIDDGSGRTADEILKSLHYTKCWTNGNLKYVMINKEIQ